MVDRRLGVAPPSIWAILQESSSESSSSSVAERRRPGRRVVLAWSAPGASLEDTSRSFQSLGAPTPRRSLVRRARVRGTLRLTTSAFPSAATAAPTKAAANGEQVRLQLLSEMKLEAAQRARAYEESLEAERASYEAELARKAREAEDYQATAPYGDRKLRTAGTMSKANLTDHEEEDALAKDGSEHLCLGIDSATLAAAKKRLDVLTTEEMLRIAMRNNVTGHLQKCIDMAVFRKADPDLIKQAQSLLEKSTAERALIAAMNSREVDKLTQAVEDAVSAGLPAADIEEAKQILAETGALLKAIKLAKRSDDAMRLNPEYAEGRSTHEESIKEAEHLVVILEVDMQLPRAIRSKDQQKLKAAHSAVLTKAKTWHIETEEVEQGEQLLSKIQADENLRLAIVSKSEEQLVAALEEANKCGAERQRILKAEAALALLRGLRELREAIESKAPGGPKPTEISKAEGLLKSLTRSVPVSRMGSKFVEEDRPPLSRLGSKFVEAVLQAVSHDRSELAATYRHANKELCRLRAELSERTVQLLELRQEFDRWRRRQAQNQCVVCLDAPANMAFVPCGHLAVCEACAGQLERLICPVCRQTSQSILHIFVP
eukprot:s511_g12.t1